MLPSIDKKKDEDKIVAVLKTSDKFNRFYETEWKTRSIPTSWYLVQDLAEKGKAHDYIEQGVRTLYIEFNHCPTIENIDIDSYIFAHEMGHIIRFYENSVLNLREIDSTQYPPSVPYTIKNHMIPLFEDTAVDHLLHEKYDFDLLPHYEKNLDNSIRNLEGLTEEPDEPLRTLLLIALIQDKLLWNLVENRESCTKWVHLEEDLKRRFLHVVKDRDELTAIIDQIVVGTKDQQKVVFKAIAERCRLAEMIRIIDDV